MKFNSLVLGFWLFFFPESPKFLIECGEADAALEILKDIYASNTGNHRSEYPVRNYLENLFFHKSIFLTSFFDLR